MSTNILPRALVLTLASDSHQPLCCQRLTQPAAGRLLQHAFIVTIAASVLDPTARLRSFLTAVA